MQENMWQATVKVLIDGQAYLYALLLRALKGEPVDEAQMEAWMREWKEETSQEIRMLLGDTEVV